LNKSFIGIKLGDGSFLPILQAGKRAKKRLVVTTSHTDQSKALIEFFKGLGESMESPTHLANLEIKDLSSRFHDVELVLDLDENDHLSVTANVVGSPQKQQIQIDTSNQAQTELSHPSRGSSVSQKSNIEDNLDTSLDFDLENDDLGLVEDASTSDIDSDVFSQSAASSIPSNDFGMNEDDEKIEFNSDTFQSEDQFKDDLSLDEDFNLDDGLEAQNTNDQEFGTSLEDPLDDNSTNFNDEFGTSEDLQSDTPLSDSALKDIDSEQDVNELKLDDLDFGDDSGANDSMENFGDDSEQDSLYQNKSKAKTAKVIDDFSLDDQDLELDSDLGSSDSDIGSSGTEQLDDFNFDSVNQNDQFDQNFTMEDLSETDLDRDLQDPGFDKISDSEDEFNLSQEDTGNTSAIADEAPPTNKNFDFKKGRADKADSPQQRTAKQEVKKEAKKESKKETKKPESKPRAEQQSSKSKSDKPDHFALILGLIIFVPLALMLIILVVLNMVKPVLRLPLSQQEPDQKVIIEIASSQLNKHTSNEFFLHSKLD